MLYFMEVGRKCIEMCPFLGCINSHTFLERTKEQRKKTKPSMRKKKPIDNRSLRCCVTFQVLWKYFFQNLKAFHKSSQKHIVFFFFFLFKAKQSSTLAVCLSFFSSLLEKKKKKTFENFIFLFTAVLAKVKPSFTLTSRSLLRLGFHFSIAAIS